MSIDSGGNYDGYIGDICRMAIQGEPDAELEDMLAEIETAQRAAMRAIKPGAIGAEVYEAGLQVVNKSGCCRSPRLPCTRHRVGKS